MLCSTPQTRSYVHFRESVQHTAALSVLLFLQYDILYELATEEIAEPEYRIGDFAGRVTMLVEAQV